MSKPRRPGPATPARLERAAGFGATSALLGAVAHGVGGGTLPDVWLLLLGGAAAALLAIPVLGREATWPRIALALAVAQAALHLLLTTTGGHHAVHGTTAGHGLTGRMLAAHVVATAVAVVWLRYAEQRLWSVARQAWVNLVLGRHRRLRIPAIGGSRPIRTGFPPPRSMLSFHLSGAVGVRGPPVPVGP